MDREWATLHELLLPAMSAGGGRPGKAAEAALREAIRSRHLAADTRLPSSRDLAGQLGLARGTVTAMYEQLVAEGYLLSKRGSGTRVAALDPGDTPTATSPPTAEHWPFNLRPGLPALAAFPRTEWLTAEREAMAATPDSALGYPDPAG